MKITIDAAMAKGLFKRYDRDYYSLEGLETIIDFYDEIDDDMEFDAIAICCDCSEYGEDCALSFSDMISSYDYLVVNECSEEWFEMDDRDKVQAIVHELEQHTTVLHVSNGNYIVFDF